MQLEVGNIVEGKITGITTFGAFVQLEGNKTGLIHISEVDINYVKDIKEHLKINDIVKVKILTIDENGKISLSIKKAIEEEQKKEQNTKRPPAQFEFTRNKENMSFEDKMKQFMLDSDEKMSEKQVSRSTRLDGIYPVLDYVKKHYTEPIDLEAAAALTGYAKTYFCRQFKLITGTSFHRYLNCYRISVACMLLDDNRLSVAQVAERTGFSSAKLLCRTFKEITGMTTTQYQKLPEEQKTIQWMR